MNRIGFATLGLSVLVCLNAWGGELGGPSLYLVPSDTPLAIGSRDAGTLFRGTVVVGNFGVKKHLLLPGNGIQRLKVSLNAPLPVASGDVVSVPFEVDCHGLDGPQDLVLEIQTTDPERRVLTQALSLFVVQTTAVAPLRSTVIATANPNGVAVGAPVPFEFLAGAASGAFVSAALEDRSAPLVLSMVKTPAGGLHGTVSIDQNAILHGAPKQGETRILGITANGNQNFIVFQWWVKDAPPSQ